MAYNKNQQAFIRRFLPHINFDQICDDDYCEIEDKVGSYYTERCIGNTANKRADILLCEEILDSLPAEP